MGGWQRRTYLLSAVFLLVGVIMLYTAGEFGLLIYRYLMPISVWILLDALNIPWNSKPWMSDSFLIYVIHNCVYITLRVAEGQMVTNYWSNFMFLFINPVIVLVITWIISRGLDKIVPLKMVLTGGR